MDGRRHEPVSERTDYGLRGKERASGREFEECGNRARGIGGVLQEQVDAGSALALLEREGCTFMAGWHQAGPLLDHPDFTKYTLRRPPPQSL